MKYLLVIALIFSACRNGAPGGSKISGSVLYRGPAAAPVNISMDAEPACAALHPTPAADQKLLTGAQGGLANAFVYIRSGLEGRKFDPPAESVVIEQKGCQFIPRVVGLRVRQTLAVKNSDPVSHNIHPTPRNNRDWNQQQPPGAPDLQRRFGFPEVMIPVKCNIHSWMRTYIAVLDHPYFAITGPDGSFQLPDLPPGNYVLAVWHEQLGEMTAPLRVESGSAAVSHRFVFERGPV